MAADELDEFLTTGNIRNSVNYPAVSMPHSGDVRVCVFHANIPAVITKIAGAIADEGINIENLINKSKGPNAYTVAEIKGDITDTIVEKLSKIEGFRRALVIR